MKLTSFRPAPAAVLAVGALVVALSGTAYAAGKINGSQIKKHTIAGNRLKPNTLTGAQINESTLGKVPAATKADTATKAGSASHATTAGSADMVGGAKVFSFHFMAVPETATKTLVVPGGTITGECPSNEPDLYLVGDESTDAPATVVVGGEDETLTNHGYTNRSDNLSVSTSIQLNYPGGIAGSGRAIVSRGTSGVTTIDFSYEAIEGGCIYSGTVLATP